MKKAKKTFQVAEMREEYDFTDGERGRYAKRFAQGSNVIVLDPDVAKIFPDSLSVNRALRTLAALARRQLEARES